MRGEIAMMSSDLWRVGIASCKCTVASCVRIANARFPHCNLGFKIKRNLLTLARSQIHLHSMPERPMRFLIRIPDDDRNLCAVA